MIELIDTFPEVNVQPAEFKRLLGFPRELVLEDRARDLAEWSRAWYSAHGRPWVYAREAESVKCDNGAVEIDDVAFHSPRLQTTLRDAEAHGAILAAVSAGPEIEAEARKAWLEEKPDEYFFLEIFGSAVVEHLTTMLGARLCAWAETRSLSVLPHYSPGYPDWDIADQARLLKVVRQNSRQPLPANIEVLDSGMLRPKKSLLAVFGLTRKNEFLRRLTDLVPCENCSYSPCQYRRAPYLRSPQFSRTEGIPTNAVDAPRPAGPVLPVLDLDATYNTSSRALGRWVEDRLTLSPQPDGSIDVLFRYDGTTCSNMGRSFTFHYHVKLGPRERGYPIRTLTCAPAPGDEGHKFMCRAMNNAEHLMVAIDHDKPLLGRPLNEVLAWDRPTMAPGCYCEPASRKHKWGLVLETIHYALAQREKDDCGQHERGAQIG